MTRTIATTPAMAGRRSFLVHLRIDLAMDSPLLGCSGPKLNARNPDDR
jgi:hypothetical protein